MVGREFIWEVGQLKVELSGFEKGNSKDVWQVVGIVGIMSGRIWDGH